MLNLQTPTPARWLEQAGAGLDELLIDHAHCEKKAAGAAMGLIFAYPDHRDLGRALAEVVQEELAHFGLVLDLLARRGIAFRRLRPAPYGERLHALVRTHEPARAIDRLLVAGLIEARSCERFGLLRDHLGDAELSAFYGGLFESEARHHVTTSGWRAAWPRPARSRSACGCSRRVRPSWSAWGTRRRACTAEPGEKIPPPAARAPVHPGGRLLELHFPPGSRRRVKGTMYAVFVDGSRQYRVSEGEVVKVDFRRASGEHPLDGAPTGSAVEFPRVLLYQNGDDTQIGQPVVVGARIVGEVVSHPSTKVYVQHFRRRKNYRRLRGHRQHYTAVRIKHILLAGQEPPVAPPVSEPAAAPAPAVSQEPTPAPAPAPTATQEPTPAPAATHEPSPAPAATPETPPPASEPGA
jgi:tRNA-(ms[2]io[6]A)-hydroxylase